jgi:hypothetical protein
LENIYASPVAANGHVYVIDPSGTTEVLFSQEVPRTVAVNRLGEPVAASLALVDQEIFIRGAGDLYCIAEGGIGF